MRGVAVEGLERPRRISRRLDISRSPLVKSGSSREDDEIHDNIREDHADKDVAPALGELGIRRAFPL